MLMTVADPDLELHTVRGVGADLLALAAFLPFVISSFFNPKYGGGGQAPAPP